MAIDLGLPANTLVSPALHAQTVASLEEFDEESQPYFSPLVEAFDQAYQGIAKVFAARAAVATDPSLNESVQILKTADLADTVLKRATATFDKGRATLENNVKVLSKSLSDPVVSRTAQPIAQEIRAHVKAMDTGNRMSFITDAIDAQDHDTVTAVLGAPSYRCKAARGCREGVCGLP